jgi:RNA polymerase sigma factor (sigma-70 family)
VQPGEDSLLEQQLLVDARTDSEAFGQFYDRTVEDVLRWFYRRVMCRETAADLCAETFARSLQSIRRFDPSRGTARAWLFGIAHHLWIDWLRKGRVADRARRRIGVERVALDDDTFERIEASVDVANLRSAMVSALEQLSPLLREAVLLRVAADLPYSEIAERLGVEQGTARVRVSRGLAQLESLLGGVS